LDKKFLGLSFQGILVQELVEEISETLTTWILRYLHLKYRKQVGLHGLHSLHD